MQQLAQNIFVFGHSMGGLISVRTALAIKTNPERVPFIPLQTHPIRLILSAPALALDKELTDVPIIITLSKFLSVVVPKAIVQNMPDKPISTISAVHDMTIRDPIVNEPTVTARFGAEFIRSIEFAVEHVKEFDFPIFLMQSYADNVVDGYGVKKWFDCISTKPENATFCEVNGFHEILFDVDRETLLTGIANFLTKHTQ
jgi:alpha-beta hydrolase superfamily lysophospholipase